MSNLEFDERLDLTSNWAYKAPTSPDENENRWKGYLAMYPNTTPQGIFERLRVRVTMHGKAAHETSILLELVDPKGLVYEALGSLFEAAMCEWRECEMNMISYQLECSMIQIKGQHTDLYYAAQTLYGLKSWLMTIMARTKPNHKNKVAFEKPSRMDSKNELAKRIREDLVFIHRWYESGYNTWKHSITEELKATGILTEFFKRNTLVVKALNGVCEIVA